MRQSYQDGPYKSFEAAVPANLVGMQGYAVELIPGTLTIQLYTGALNVPLGVLFQELEGDVAWVVRLLGKGGTLRAVAGGTLGSAGSFVTFQNGGTLIATPSNDLAHGIKLSDVGANVANDIVEIVDMIVPTAVAT